MLNWAVIQTPTEYPITVDQLKSHLRLEPDENHENEYLQLLVEDTAALIQQYINAPLMNQGIRQYWDGFPSGPQLDLGFSQISYVSNIQYISLGDEYDRYSDFEIDDVIVSLGVQPHLYLAPGKSWPITAAVPNAVYIDYAVGYRPDNLPGDIRRAALLIAADHYCKREDTVKNMVSASQLILDKYTEWRF